MILAKNDKKIQHININLVNSFVLIFLKRRVFYLEAFAVIYFVLFFSLKDFSLQYDKRIAAIKLNSKYMLEI